MRKRVIESLAKQEIEFNKKYLGIETSMEEAIEHQTQKLARLDKENFRY
tara:strand:- start:309 stop:455 length:147 start_codon:yes stop_codon:yes gene_type:complete